MGPVKKKERINLGLGRLIKALSGNLSCNTGGGFLSLSFSFSLLFVFVFSFVVACTEMTEKTSPPNAEQQENYATQLPATVSGNEVPPQVDTLSKPRLNGGLQAWLTVLALFCVFVNSW